LIYVFLPRNANENEEKKTSTKNIEMRIFLLFSFEDESLAMSKARTSDECILFV
jgi:hypothetical protein